MALGPRLPLVGLAAAFAALALFVSGLPWRALDAVTLALFALGLGISAGGYLLGQTGENRRLAVIALGANGLGVAVLAILYGPG